MRRSLLRAASAMLLVTLAACDMAPDYHRPEIASPPAFKEADGWVAATPGDQAPRGDWWAVFGEPELNLLEQRVTVDNQSLKAAIARFDQARSDARVAQADYYPTLDTSASATRNGTSRRTANALPHNSFNTYSSGIDLSYEIDVWGRVRNQAEAGKARAQASESDLASVELALHAELAADYFILRGYDSEQDILDRTVEDYRKSLELTQARFGVGYAAKPDLAAAEAQYQGARTQAAETRLKRASLEHAIAVLVGEVPANFSLPARPLEGTPPAVAQVLPAELLQRRPDIAAAERRAAAANNDIGVARAAYYPSFNLNALFGVEAALPNKLFTAPAETWGFGPQAVLNLFDGGRRDALTDKARAGYDEAVANYRQTVLSAYGEVEDQLAAYKRLAEEASTQQAAVTAAAEATGHAEKLYGGGLSAYYDVIVAQNIELSARLSDADIRTRRMTAGVLLIKALGGGWTPEQS